MFSFNTGELVLVLVIALVVFGPGKLPDVGKAIGRSVKEFRHATTGEGEEVKEKTEITKPALQIQTEEKK
ncbi:MAG: Sec-independent protein translocase protein tatA/E-like protein [Firmicutes bacterium]|nr:Sec-independent protein translocase protein tatA/E-like protein [Bacillota bacterium]